MPYRPANPIAAALAGALLAVVIAYALSFAGLYTGVANITAPAAPAQRGPAAFVRAGVNLYAMQHVTLAGSGTVTSDFAGTQRVSSRITLPLTLWAAIPALALIVGGFAAGARRRGTGSLSIVLTAVLAGIIYAAILSALSFALRAQLDPSAMPSIDGTDFNPPPIRLQPAFASTILSTGLFGVVFAHLGGMLASRRERGRVSPNRWWVCGKAIILTAIIIQLIVIIALGGWLYFSPPEDLSAPSTRWQVFAMSPTVSGIVYSLIHGATLVGSVESPLQSEEDTLGGRANIYTGIDLAGRQNAPRPLSSAYVYIVAAIGALAALIAGSMSVRWGSRDGSLLTAFRIAVILAVFILLLAFFCGFGWSSREGGAAFTLSIALTLGWPFAIALGAVFVAALLGAYITSAYYSSRRGFPSDL